MRNTESEQAKDLSSHSSRSYWGCEEQIQFFILCTTKINRCFFIVWFRILQIPIVPKSLTGSSKNLFLQ
ncbi:MAG: hypothetical protein Q4C95_11155 [Planctomycetia bacterium]|nr:hypothetical protein [Planctomycetia bacterium]